GTLGPPVNPCSPAKISWLGVIPFASAAISETAMCVNIGGLISFESMFDRIMISVNTEGLFLNQSLSYDDFTEDPVSTDMTNDYISLPERDCAAFDIGVGARLHLIDRWFARCNTSAKTRFACYASCDRLRYANTKLWNCTELTWRNLHNSTNHSL